MRHKLFNIIAVYAVFAAMLLALNGCQAFKKDATARDKYADAERSFIVVIDTAKAAYQAGHLKGDTLEVVKAALIQAGSALDEMNRHVKAGNTVQADYWLARVRAAVNIAQTILIGRQE